MKTYSRILPFLNWFPMNRQDLQSDMMAGLAVALILIPQSMASAQLAGMPPHYGLYAAFLPVIVAALWGSSKQLSTGPVAIVALLSAASLAPFAVLGSETFIAYAILLAFMVGVIQLILGLFKMGVIVNFVSHPVIVGFTNAAAIIIALSQLNNIFGIEVNRTDHFIHDIFTMLGDIGLLHVPTLCIGVLAFVIMWSAKRYFPKLPGVLIAVSSCIMLSWLTGFNKNGGAIIGVIPQGLPPFAVPAFDFSIMRDLFSSALIIAMVGFMGSVSVAKSIAARNRDRVDPNQELIGQGLANIVGSFSGSFPVSGSLARSAVNFNSGATTGMSSVFTAFIVFISLMFLTPLLFFLPLSVLAAIIIMAVSNLINFKAMKYAWDVNKHDGIATIVTFVATLLFAPHLDTGILLGVFTAISMFLYRSMRPQMVVLGRYSKTGVMHNIKNYSDLVTDERIIILRFDMGLYFANVSYFENSVIKHAANYPKAKFMLIVSDGIHEIDASGEEMLHNIVRRLRSSGITMVFSGFKRQVLNVINKTNLAKEIGENHLYSSENIALIGIYKELGDFENTPLLQYAPRLQNDNYESDNVIKKHANNA